MHKDLRANLQRASSVAVPDSTTIAGCFVNFKMRMLKYGEYCSRLERAQKRIAESCLSKPAVRDVVDVRMFLF